MRPRSLSKGSSRTLSCSSPLDSVPISNNLNLTINNGYTGGLLNSSVISNGKLPLLNSNNVSNSSNSSSNSITSLASLLDSLNRSEPFSHPITSSLLSTFPSFDVNSPVTAPPSPIPTAHSNWKNHPNSIGCCSQQGRRPYQEDSFAIGTNLPSVPNFIQSLSQNLSNNLNNYFPVSADLSNTHFIGLFDGHAGGKCSSFLSQNIIPHFLNQHFHQSLQQLNSQASTNSQQPPTPALALRKAYHSINENFLSKAEKMKLYDGSTGLCCILSKVPSNQKKNSLHSYQLIIANVGDCRAIIIGSSPNLVTQLTTDHKPSNIEEQKRINMLGGQIVNCMGVLRVNRVLAVSRAFGNRTLRSVIRPDADLVVKDLFINPDSNISNSGNSFTDTDEFLVIASDGLWDVLSPRDVAEICHQKRFSSKAQQISEELVNLALAKGSCDNVTCLVVSLKNLHELEIQTDKELENSNQSCEIDIKSNNNKVDSNQIPPRPHTLSTISPYDLPTEFDIIQAKQSISTPPSFSPAFAGKKNHTKSNEVNQSIPISPSSNNAPKNLFPKVNDKPPLVLKTSNRIVKPTNTLGSTTSTTTPLSSDQLKLSITSNFSRPSSGLISSNTMSRPSSSKPSFQIRSSSTKNP